MGPTKSTALQWRVVLVLAGVFGIVLVWAGGQMGWLAPRQPDERDVRPARIEPVAPEPQPRGSSVERALALADAVAGADAIEPPTPDDAKGPGRVIGEPSYTAQELRDPLEPWFPEETPAVAAAPMEGEPPVASADPLHLLQPMSPPEITLQGIVWGGPEPQAIINHQVYTVGDSVSGARIVAIGRRGVTVEWNGTPVVYSVALAP